VKPGAAVANTERWLCCQLRAREHFMVPVGLARRHALSHLVTDLWVPPGSATGRLVPRLRAVYHPDLDGRVSAFNAEALLFEAGQTLARASGWPRIVKRNEWFQSRVVALLKKRSPDATVLFSYSYAARRPFEFAKAAGWKTVMVQIDAGPGEERLVASWQSRHPGLEAHWRPAPAEYWTRWRAEIDLADRVIVHSRWSRDALIAEGVNGGKLVVVPLAYEPPAEAAAFERTYPDRFSSDRPLRVLFLGQVTLRKGALAMLDAARELRDEPIEFIVAGPNALDLSRRPAGDGRIQWLGPVPRGRTAAVYQGRRRVPAAHAVRWLWPRTTRSASVAPAARHDRELRRRRSRRHQRRAVARGVRRGGCSGAQAADCGAGHYSKDEPRCPHRRATPPRSILSGAAGLPPVTAPRVVIVTHFPSPYQWSCSTKSSGNDRASCECCTSTSEWRRAGGVACPSPTITSTWIAATPHWRPRGMP
jgi:hypothetical protein